MKWYRFGDCPLTSLYLARGSGGFYKICFDKDDSCKLHLYFTGNEFDERIDWHKLTSWKLEIDYKEKNSWEKYTSCALQSLMDVGDWFSGLAHDRHLVNKSVFEKFK